MKPNDLILVAYAGTFSLFCYKTEDLCELVEKEGYFSKMKGTLRKGDVIFIDCPDKKTIYSVLDNECAVSDMMSRLSGLSGSSSPAFKTQENIVDVIIEDLPEKYDSFELDENFRSLSLVVNDILAVLRAVKILG